MEYIFSEGMTCPDCGKGHLERVVQTESFHYADERFTLDNVASYICPACGDGTFAPEEAKELEKKIADARRRIDGLLTSEEIRALRKSVGMTQVEFARLFKVGEKNFARYETGQSTQERGMDWALRFLKIRPELFNVMHGRPLEPAAHISYEIPKASAGKVIRLPSPKIALENNTVRTSVEDSSIEIAV